MTAPLPDTTSFTSISIWFDEILFPQPLASTLPGATNIQLQRICPLRVVDHVRMAADVVAYDLVIDALTHNGRAYPAWISSADRLSTSRNQRRLARLLRERPDRRSPVSGWTVAWPGLRPNRASATWRSSPSPIRSGCPDSSSADTSSPP